LPIKNAFTAVAEIRQLIEMKEDKEKGKEKGKEEKEKEKRKEKKEEKGLVCLDNLFNKAALNVVWNFVSGTRYGYHDQRMHRLLGTTTFYIFLILYRFPYSKALISKCIPSWQHFKCEKPSL
jgi:hypothetical protein